MHQLNKLIRPEHIGFAACGHLKHHYLLNDESDFVESLCGRLVYSNDLPMVEKSEHFEHFVYQKRCLKCTRLYFNDLKIIENI